MTESIRALAGKLMMVGIPGPELDPATRKLLVDHAIGGVILFRRNVRDVPTLVRLTSDLHALFPERPMLVAIDHEGGRVNRLPEPFTAFPAAAKIGAAGSPHLAYRQGIAMGEELRSVGIDVDFAPVLDVNSNPRNPVIGDRSYGNQARTVARMGLSLAHGLQKSGVVPCGKHFPGHGDTDVDSHHDLPVVRKGFGDLERTDVFPFRRAIQGGIDALMTAHVVYSSLDAVRPATLSRRILSDVLRDRLHFRGVLFSDDLEMKAIADRFGPEDAALRSIDAGVDALLFCERAQLAVAAIEAIVDAAGRRSRMRERVEESAARLDQLHRTHARRSRRPYTVQPIPPEGLEKNRKLVGWIEERAAKV